jgi:hypothetical protein
MKIQMEQPCIRDAGCGAHDSKLQTKSTQKKIIITNCKQKAHGKTTINTQRQHNLKRQHENKQKTSVKRL